MPTPRPSSPPAPGPAAAEAAPLPPGITGAGSARGRAKPPRHLADLGLPERRAAVAELGERPFRADQLSRQYFARLADEPGEMTDLPQSSRQGLADALLPRLLTAERELECDGGTTRKTLWRTFDHAYVESVLMRYPGRVTMCISSQAGCGMACPFCATGQAGLTRNLSTGEIVEQVVAGAARSPGARCRAARAGSPTWSSWAWVSRSPITAAWCRPCAA